MTRVYFHQKPGHRERQRDTYRIGKTLIEAFSPEGANSPKQNNLLIEKKGQQPISRIISVILSCIPIINIRWIIPKEKNIDFIYTWGDIPFGTDIPYIIELDNPSILTLYNNFALKLYRPLLIWLLKKKNCHKIVCISEACQAVFLSIFGESFRYKTIVLPPHTKEKERKDEADGVIRYVWIGLRNQGKGGRETLEAFRKIEAQNIELHIIGWQNPAIESIYQKDERIIFHGPLEREVILTSLLPGYDVLIFPTLYESLGMVALEALCAGLGIITTDTFALPEICQDGINGRLLPHPYLGRESLSGKEIVNVTKMHGGTFYKKYHIKEDTLHPYLVEKIEGALRESLTEYKNWKEGSKKIYQEHFSPRIWKSRFISLFS